jgi:SAM-dependent methyltransferase
MSRAAPVAGRPTDGEVWHDVECGGYAADLPLWRRLVRQVAAGERTCELLELGAGAGRVALDLARRGCRVTALDRDPELVAALRRRAGGLSLDTVLGDASRFELGKRFDLVLAPMQLVQLLPDATARASMFGSIERHLRSGGTAALALLDLGEGWEAAEEEAPTPDMAELGGHVYSSQPVAVRRIDRGRAVELDRVRKVVRPDGGLRQSFDRIRLELLSPAAAEREARAAGLAPRGRIEVPPTEHHLGSTVVVLERRG